MADIINFTIDGKECVAEKGTLILQAAQENDIYIPTLCNYEGVKPQGSCRICTIKTNGQFVTACTTPVADGMEIENNTEEINDLRKSIIELLFVEGNHFCPACEMSGDCELQALAYRFQMMVPRFTYQFPKREIDARNPKILMDSNRCIRCKRCIRAIKDEKERSIFAFHARGRNIEVHIDPDLGSKLTDELAEKSVTICPVGAILPREKGFRTPIGQRKFDHEPIGSEYKY